jgi:predicted DsbA family dithiol-disulfide isomerase
MSRRNILLAGSGLFAFILIVGFLILRPNAEERYAGALTLRDSEYTLGSKDAHTKLVAYLDIACETCAGHYDTLRMLAEETSSDLAIGMRILPMSALRPNAQVAAQAFHVAGLQEAGLPMLDLLFENQRAWIDEADPVPIFSTYAERLGLDVERFRKDMDSGKVSRRIAADRESADTLGVDKAPAFFLNGMEVLEQRTHAEFKRIVLDAVYE